MIYFGGGLQMNCFIGDLIASSYYSSSGAFVVGTSKIRSRHFWVGDFDPLIGIVDHEQHDSESPTMR